MKTTDQSTLSSGESLALWVPLAGAVAFGVVPFALGGAFGALLGFPGNDSFLYRLAGAATFGYAISLFMGMRNRDWAGIRQVVIATLTFNVASIFACLAEIIAGPFNLIEYVILATSIAIVVITGTTLYRHSGARKSATDLSNWSTNLLIPVVLISGLFGLLPLPFPLPGSQFSGY